MATSIEIQAMVRNLDESLRKHKKLKESNPKEWKEILMNENARLVEEFPSVFDMHIEGKLDETFFFMLQMKHKIEKGDLTEEQASIAVGQKLYNRYVEPVVKNLPTPSSLSYEDYYKQYAGTSENKSS